MTTLDPLTKSPELAARGKYRVVVPVSGGKDSQACLKLALQTYPADEVLGLFCDTKFEHPLTYEHVERMREMYGVDIKVLNNGSVEEQILKHGRFPGGGARFCTEELKIWPSKRFYKALAEEQGGFEVWYGMRFEEGTERRTRYAGKVCDELYLPNDVLKKYPKYLGKLGVRFRLAVLHWQKADVFDFLDGRHNPLYDILNDDGLPKFDRVGCFPCQAGGDKSKEAAFQHDDFGRSQFVTVIRLSKQIGKSIWTSKGGKARNEEAPPCSVCSM